MPSLKRDIDGIPVCGYYEGGWQELAEAFCTNFSQRRELGASLCVTRRSKIVVDMWGGFKDDAQTVPWDEETICVVFSSTKGATAFCAHILCDRGLLRLDALVGEYWPQFATNGKERATVAMMLNHSAGVPGLRAPLKDRAFADWDYMVQHLAEEKPFWEPGTRNGYHALVYGWTIGELVRRVSGKSLGTFFNDEIAKRLKLDFWIGLPEEVEPRVAPLIPYVLGPDEPAPEFVAEAAAHPLSASARALGNTGGYMSLNREDGIAAHERFGVNQRWAHKAEIGSAGGITNARGLAGLYAPLAMRGGGIVSPVQAERMGQVSTATMRDAVLLIPTRFSLGYMCSMDNRGRNKAGGESMIIGSRAFGHVGAGGSFGFADPECELSFGYTMNRMGPGILLNERGQSLVDSAYRCLGYRDDRAGVWMM